jgi:hypothetical protein
MSLENYYRCLHLIGYFENLKLLNYFQEKNSFFISNNMQSIQYYIQCSLEMRNYRIVSSQFQRSEFSNFEQYFELYNYIKDLEINRKKFI